MSATSNTSVNTTIKLIRLFNVEKQLRGLKSRLLQAERFLKQQEHQIKTLDAQSATLDAEAKQLRASIANHEGEAKRLDEKVAELREQMNAAQTNKEYKAFLSEVNTFTEQKSEQESAALELLEKVEEIEGKVAELAGQREEREKVRAVAAGERDERAKEIEGRVSELESDLESRRAEVPANAIAAYDELLELNPEEDPMAPIEIANKKRHEYHCGSCMMGIPMEAVSSLLSHGGLTRCPSCTVILYLEEESIQALQPA